MDQPNDSVTLPLARLGLPTSLIGKYGVDVAPFVQNGYSYLVPYARLLTWPLVTLILMSCTAFYAFSLVFYRLYLSPLAPFPGPFLAKITHWYEFYYNVIHIGKYYETIRDMHEKYGKSSCESVRVNINANHRDPGPVVRVTPEEIHVMEPSAYNKLFVIGAVRKTNSYPRFSNGTGFEGSSHVVTLDIGVEY
jgi:hypothetical protein